MKITTKARYAVTTMMELAIHDMDGSLRLVDISKNHVISKSYLEQIIASLRQHGLVEGVRGPGGGYRLSKPADQISIAAIIKAVEDTIDETGCSGKTYPNNGQGCLSQQLWEDLSMRLYEFMDGITLNEFVRRPEIHYRLDSMSVRIASMFPPTIRMAS